MNWINVDVRMPERGVRVLVYLRDGGAFVGEWWPHWSGRALWFNVWQSGHLEKTSVSHWTPIVPPRTAS